MKLSDCAKCEHMEEEGKREAFCARYGKPCNKVKACSILCRVKFNRPFTAKSARIARRHYERTFGEKA